mgnify:CR=1 FL=1
MSSNSEKARSDGRTRRMLGGTLVALPLVAGLAMGQPLGEGRVGISGPAVVTPAGGNSRDQVELAPEFELGPIAMVSQGWHDAPAVLSVRPGTILQFRLTWDAEHDVRWFGASEIRATATSSTAQMRVSGSSSTKIVRVDIYDAGGQLVESMQTQINVEGDVAAPSSLEPPQVALLTALGKVSDLMGNGDQGLSAIASLPDDLPPGVLLPGPETVAPMVYFGDPPYDLTAQAPAGTGQLGGLIEDGMDNGLTGLGLSGEAGSEALPTPPVINATADGSLWGRAHPVITETRPETLVAADCDDVLDGGASCYAPGQVMSNGQQGLGVQGQAGADGLTIPTSGRFVAELSGVPYIFEARPAPEPVPVIAAGSAILLSISGAGADLAEWRIDGQPVGLGSSFIHVVVDPGPRIVSVGPPGSDFAFRFEVARRASQAGFQSESILAGDGGGLDLSAHAGIFYPFGRPIAQVDATSAYGFIDGQARIGFQLRNTGRVTGTYLVQLDLGDGPDGTIVDGSSAEFVLEAGKTIFTDLPADVYVPPQAEPTVLQIDLRVFGQSPSYGEPGREWTLIEQATVSLALEPMGS